MTNSSLAHYFCPKQLTQSLDLLTMTNTSLASYSVANSSLALNQLNTLGSVWTISTCIITEFSLGGAHRPALNGTTYGRVHIHDSFVHNTDMT